jgi:predicted TIM-barrel fold metal-dependent hydrolase
VTDIAIDVWAQPAPGAAFRSAMFATLVERAHASERVAHAGSAEAIVAAMDTAGLSKALLSAWCLQDGWMITNDQVAEFVRAAPQRLIGVACANLDDPQAPSLLERSVREQGFKALRIIPWVWGRPPTHASYEPLLTKCVELNIPFCTQVGHAGPRMLSEPGRPIPYIDEIALRYPSLRIVCGHIGYPWTDEMIALAWKYDNVFIDTSAYLPRYYPPQLVTFMNSNGRDKVMFGTNFPMLSFQECLQQALELKISDASKQKFLSDNAKGVFAI